MSNATHGYGQVFGGEHNSLWEKDGNYYRFSEGRMHFVDGPNPPKAGKEDAKAAKSKSQAKRKDVEAGKHDEAIASLLADYSAEELQAMASGLKQRLEDGGVENDIVVSADNDEAGARANAEVIAQFAD